MGTVSIVEGRIDCSQMTTRQINTAIRHAAQRGSSSITLINPDTRHNLAVGIVDALRINIEGSVGYYAGGLSDGIQLTINGVAGWGLAENLMSGEVLLKGSAGQSAAASIRGGRVVIQGDAGARCGIAMKGGTVVVGGNVGYMSAFMMQKGILVVCGDADEALGDSIYEGVIYLRGTCRSLGSDAEEQEFTEQDLQAVSAALKGIGIDANPADFRRIASARRLYNFSTKERKIWTTAL